MTWTRLGDNFYDRADLLQVPRSARLLHVEALVYCNRELLNGALPRAALRRITDAEDPELDAKHLVDAGVWTLTETGWQLDWSDQEDAEDVRARQERRAEKQKAYRKRKAAHDQGDHSLCKPGFCNKAVTGNATRNATSNADGNEQGLVTPSRPVPSRPVGTGIGTGEARGSGAGAPTPHFQNQERRWRGWEPTAEAHPFVPSMSDPRVCSWQSDHEACNGKRIDSWEHGHAFLAVKDENTECVKCAMPEAHAIHNPEVTNAPS